MIRRNIGCRASQWHRELTPPVPAAVSSGKPPESGCRGDAERAPVLMQPTLWNEKELKPPPPPRPLVLGTEVLHARQSGATWEASEQRSEESNGEV